MNVFERESETILDLFGDIGGFYEAINILISPLILYYSAKKFDFSISNGAPVYLKRA